MNVWNVRKCYYGIFMVFYVLYHPTDSGAVQLTSQNIDMTLASNELVIINFYANWCRFSNMLSPIFDDAADKIKTLPHPEGRVVLGKLDCEKEVGVSSRFHITKYPTIKIVRNGEISKREYRGQRSVDAFVEYVNNQLRDPCKEFTDLKTLNELDKNKPTIIGYFDRRDQPEYNTLMKVASNLKDECDFHVGFGDVVKAMHPPGKPIIVFKEHDNDETYTGNLNHFDELKIWAQGKCIRLVREITFQNAEELTEEGLPFLILFHDTNDVNSIKEFTEAVKEQLFEEKPNIIFLTADAKQFSHPLRHMGKSAKDLPLIAIDSFKHMYAFGNFSDIHNPGKLKMFMKDFYSGKLHREFHYGPDESTVQSDAEVVNTSPPESSFKKLGPSKNRYTLLEKDEL